MAATLLRRPDDHRVGFAELFFDLVFVFAITQISHHLLYHYNLRGALESVLLFLGIWWVWIYTTWVINRLDPERGAVRGLIFALMALGLYVSMAIPTAFGDRAPVFALAFVAMNVGRTLFMLAVVQGDDPRLRRTYLRILIWFLVAAVPWIAGAFGPDDTRLPLWGLALAIEYIGPSVGFVVPGLGRDMTSNWAVKGAHMAERCGLFVIICLGETLLVSGATFAGTEWTVAGHAAFLASVAGSISMWWVYFHIGYRRGTQQIETSADPGRLARLAFTYAHIPIVAGIVLSAVGAERAIAHPGDPGSLAEAASVVGGVALFLAGNAWFKRISGRIAPLSHLVGIGLCAVLALVSPALSLMALTLAATGVLIVTAVWEHLSIGHVPLQEP
jgi:low temperature requirement protein LtrA